MPLLSLLCLLPGLSGAQSLDQKITFAEPPARAKDLIERLAKQTGESLSVAPLLTDDVLHIRVREVTLSELMAKIAVADDAEWEKTSTGYRLTRSSALVQKQERQELADRGAELDKTISNAIERASKAPPMNADEAKRIAEAQRKMTSQIDRANGGAFRIPPISADLRDQMPGSRTIVRLLGEIGGVALAKVGAGERAVWSTNANAVQGRLGGKSSEILRQFIADQKLLSQEVQKGQENEGRQVRIIGITGGEMGPGDPSLGLGKAILIADRTGGNYRFQLIVADPNGQTITTASYSFGFSVLPRSESTAGKKIVLSPLAAEYAKLTRSDTAPGMTVARRGVVMMRTGSGGGTTFTSGDDATKVVELSPELRARLLQPEKYDPQGLAVAEGLQAAAGDRNLVAVVPDSAIAILTRRLGDGVEVEDFVAATLPKAGEVIEAADGWFVGRPKYPVSARRAHIPRGALGTLARAIDTKKNARLDDLAAFAMAAGRSIAASDTEAQTLRLINAPAMASAMGMLTDADVLRLYGTLSRAQRGTLETGASLSLATFNDVQSSLISHAVYQSQDGPQPGGEQRIRMLVPTSLETERTEMLPNGVAKASTLAAKVDQQESVVAYDASGGATVMSSDQLAMRMLQSERPDFAFFGEVAKVERFQPAGQTQIVFTFQLAPNVFLTRTLLDTTFDASAARVPFDALPSGFKDRVHASLEQLRSASKGLQVSPTNRNIPPAP